MYFPNWFIAIFALVCVVLILVLIFWHPKSTCSRLEIDAEMKELISYGADAFAAWVDEQRDSLRPGEIRHSDTDEPFGPRTGWMLQALSRMNDSRHRRSFEYTDGRWHTYSFNYGGDDGSALAIDGIEAKESVIFWARVKHQLTLEEALRYKAGWSK